MTTGATNLQHGLETPSGKAAEDENFPVASYLVAHKLRPHVRCFYDFARAADDIADNPALSPVEKIRRLDQFEEGLSGRGPEKSRKLAQSLDETGVTDRHARDLLAAFRMDSEKSRYRDWSELLRYCTLSANPVGRYLMDLHREDQTNWSATDALCTVLQILNHLQDCKNDYLEMDRVYIPEDMLLREGIDVSALRDECASPAFRRVLDRILNLCDELLDHARERHVRPVSRRLHAETVLITRLAMRLSRRLRRQDPLAERVKLSKADFLIASIAGLIALGTPMRG